MSVSVFLITCNSCTCSVTICLRSVIFWSTLANSCEDSGWFSLSWSSRACSRLSWMSSMGFTFSKPGRSGRNGKTKGSVKGSLGWLSGLGSFRLLPPQARDETQSSSCQAQALLQNKAPASTSLCLCLISLVRRKALQLMGETEGWNRKTKQFRTNCAM